MEIWTFVLSSRLINLGVEQSLIWRSGWTTLGISLLEWFDSFTSKWIIWVWILADLSCGRDWARPPRVCFASFSLVLFAISSLKSVTFSEHLPSIFWLKERVTHVFWEASTAWHCFERCFVPLSFGPDNGQKNNETPWLSLGLSCKEKRKSVSVYSRTVRKGQPC